MTAILSDENRIGKWWLVERATTEAAEELGYIPAGTTNAIDRQIGPITSLVQRALEIEETTGHDVQSFVDAVRENLDPHLRRFVHGDTTSSDTTESAVNMVVREGLSVILATLDELIEAVKQKAIAYKGVRKIGRTHTQHGAPSDEGLYFLGWYDALLRRRNIIERAMEVLRVGKIRGLVGTYDQHVTPELEALALHKLGLEPVLTCYQIILRDRFCDGIYSLSALAAIIENMAVNIRLGAQTEVGEFSEPFRKGRKGSSNSPHKRNTDRDENITGLCRTIRNEVSVELENIVTWWERDISHSAPERIILDTIFHAMHFVLKRLVVIVRDLVIYDSQIEQNLNLTQGVIYSADVKSLLMEAGMDPEDAYRVTQELSQQAWDERRDFIQLLLDSPAIPDELKQGEIQQCFDIERKLLHVPTIFARFNL